MSKDLVRPPGINGKEPLTLTGFSMSTSMKTGFCESHSYVHEEEGVWKEAFVN
jgi:hypothetical protein